MWSDHQINVNKTEHQTATQQRANKIPKPDHPPAHYTIRWRLTGHPFNWGVLRLVFPNFYLTSSIPPNVNISSPWKCIPTNNGRVLSIRSREHCSSLFTILIFREPEIFPEIPVDIVDKESLLQHQRLVEPNRPPESYRRTREPYRAQTPADSSCQTSAPAHQGDCGICEPSGSHFFRGLPVHNANVNPPVYVWLLTLERCQTILLLMLLVGIRIRIKTEQQQQQQRARKGFTPSGSAVIELENGRVRRMIILKRATTITEGRGGVRWDIMFFLYTPIAVPTIRHFFVFPIFQWGRLRDGWHRGILRWWDVEKGRITGCCDIELSGGKGKRIELGNALCDIGVCVELMFVYYKYRFSIWGEWEECEMNFVFLRRYSVRCTPGERWLFARFWIHFQ